MLSSKISVILCFEMEGRTVVWKAVTEKAVLD